MAKPSFTASLSMPPSMTRYTTHLETTGKTRSVPVSLPFVAAIADEPAYAPRPDARPPKHRAHRVPRFKTLVRMALAADDAEQLGQAIRKRLPAQARRREPTENELVELDRMFGSRAD